MQVGLIGCGRISKTHFETLNKLPGARIIGCCDIVEERAKTSAEKYNIPFWTTNYEDLLKIKEIDLISICTPSGLHPEHGIMAANYKKHVLTEKPMGVKLAEADKLIKTCAEKGVKLFVVMQNRFNPAIQMVKNAIDKGRFGKLYMIIANVLWTRPQEYYDMASWRGTWALDGGAFCNQASHYIDLVQWFAGTPQSVTSQTATLARKIEGEDSGSAIIRFKSGCIATINVTMLTYPKNLEGSITIIGEKGTARIGGIAVNEILHWEFSDYDETDGAKDAASTYPDSVYGFGHSAYYQNILNFFAGSEKPLVDGWEGRKSLELIQSIYLSNQEQKTILL